MTMTTRQQGAGSSTWSGDILEAAWEGVDNLSHCVMAVGWVYAEAVPLAAQVGEAARESTPLAAGLCNGMSTSQEMSERQYRRLCVGPTIRLLLLTCSCGLTRMSAHIAGSTSMAVPAKSICVSVENRMHAYKQGNALCTASAM